ncbi:hypothetical protein [Runella salmonicolor]|uniref:Uncharacterized protein n=1 Tax=Runella salmonicolor TaxID=2950278 RepID=A0ABT1FLQ4_9BACT|nr:hypothetical protein [Runella salmonicolor]MCP1382703.1 hypothetical protein [Runella salmonicolor]
MRKFLLVFCLIFVFQSCIVRKANYKNKGSINNNSAIFSINGATLNNKKSVIGITTQIISVGVGGYLGYKYFPVALGYSDGKLNTNSIGGAVIGGIAGYGLNNSFDYLLGDRKQFLVNQSNYATWKRKFDPNKRYIALNNNYGNLEFVDKSYESNFTVNNLQDAIYFKKAFPQSQYSSQVFNKAVSVSNRYSLQEISKVYPNENQENLSKKHLLSSTNFDEYKQSIEYFPSIKPLGESYLANSAKDYSNLQSFDALYPNSLLTKDIARRIIPNISLSELRPYLNNYKKYLTFADFPNYFSADKKEYLYEWLLAFNDNPLSKSAKIKYLNFSNSLEDFISSSKSLKLNFVNNEYDLYENNKSLTNGEVLFYRFNDVSNQFESNLINKLKQEIIVSTLENVTNNYKSLNSARLEDLSNTLKSNTWLSKNAKNETLGYTLSIDTQKALASIREFNTEFLAALNEKNETLVRKYLKDGADIRNLNYDQFYFVAQIEPTKENSEILYQKLTKYDQYASFLRLFPSYTEEFERKVSEWKRKKCELYVSSVSETSFTRTGSYLWSKNGLSSKNSAVIYDLVVPQEKLDEYKTHQLMIHKINEKETKGIFDFGGAINGYDYWVITDRNDFNKVYCRAEENDGYRLESEKDFDNFIEKIVSDSYFQSKMGCKNEIVFKKKLHDQLSPEQKERRLREAELRQQREVEYNERKKRIEQEAIVNKEIKDFQDFKSRTSFKLLGIVEDKGIIFKDFTGFCPCDKYELRKENFWIDDKFDVYQDKKGKWYVLRNGFFATDDGPYNTSDELLRYIYNKYFNR